MDLFVVKVGLSEYNHVSFCVPIQVYVLADTIKEASNLVEDWITKQKHLTGDSAVITSITLKAPGRRVIVQRQHGDK